MRQLDPTYKYALGALIHCKMHVCNWSGLTEDIDRLSEEVRQGKCASEPVYAAGSMLTTERAAFVCADIRRR